MDSVPKGNKYFLLLVAGLFLVGSFWIMVYAIG